MCTVSWHWTVIYTGPKFYNEVSHSLVCINLGLGQCIHFSTNRFIFKYWVFINHNLVCTPILMNSIKDQILGVTYPKIVKKPFQTIGYGDLLLNTHSNRQQKILYIRITPICGGGALSGGGSLSLGRNITHSLVMQKCYASHVLMK